MPTKRETQIAKNNSKANEKVEDETKKKAMCDKYTCKKPSLTPASRLAKSIDK